MALYPRRDELGRLKSGRRDSVLESASWHCLREAAQEYNNMKAIKEIIRGALCFAAVLYASAFIREPEPTAEGGEA